MSFRGSPNFTKGTLSCCITPADVEDVMKRTSSHLVYVFKTMRKIFAGPSRIPGHPMRLDSAGSSKGPVCTVSQGWDG